MAVQDQPELQEVETGFTPPPGDDLFAKYGMQAAIGAVGLLLVVGVYVFFSSRSKDEAETAWSRFARAEDAGTFATIADDYPNHPVGVWARLAEGESYLQEALRLQTTDGKAAKAEFKKAEDAFELLAKLGSLPPDAKLRAELCNAWLLEATCDGDTEKVMSAYEGFLKNNPESLYEGYIKQRVEALKSDDAEAFYAWFSKQNPKPDDFQTPRDGFPGGFPGGMPPGHPEMPVTLPQIPEELFPADWDELKSGELPELGEGEPETGTEGEGTEGEGTEGEGTEAKPAEETKPAIEGEPKDTSTKAAPKDGTE
jgi:hypothetical protein